MRCFNKLLLCSCLAACFFSLQSCSQSDLLDEPALANANLPAAISQDFSQNFPDATSVIWNVDSSYAYASFSIPNRTGELASSAVWYSMLDQQRSLLSSNVEYDGIPDAVKEAFQNSDYAAWEVSLVTQINRYGHYALGEIYVIKAQGSFADDSTLFEVALYYTAEGLLVHLDLDEVHQNDHQGYGDWVIDNVPDYVSNYVNSNYPGARYVHIYVADDGVVVEILDQHTIRTLYFDAEGNWTATRTKVDDKKNPAEVRNALNTLHANHTKVCGIEECVNAAGETYYIVTVKVKDGDKTEIRIDLDGSIVDGDSAGDDDNDPTTVDGDLLQNRAQVEAYIQGRYPDATIRDWDEDNKKLEVEILYTGIKINVTFDRSADGYTWSSSEWDLDYRQPSSLPDAVKTAIETAYPDYQIYFASYSETADEGNYYLVGLKSGRSNVKVKLDEQGNILAEYGK
ncbi:MAG: PepSY-like domain-containing protein [Lepagella sp.]